MHYYLFENKYNGYYTTCTPFKCEKPISQKEAYDFMKLANPILGRIGGTLFDLKNAADDKGYNLIPYFCTYKHPKDSNESWWLNLNLDVLPQEFHKWDIIEGISGNY